MKKQRITAVAAVAMLASTAAGTQPIQGSGDHGDLGHAEGLNSKGCYNGERYNDGFVR